MKKLKVQWMRPKEFIAKIEKDIAKEKLKEKRREDRKRKDIIKALSQNNLDVFK